MWDTLDTCFNRSEKYIVEALDPVVRGTDCMSMLLSGSLLAAKVNHDGSKGCKFPEKADKQADLTRNYESDAPCRLEPSRGPSGSKMAWTCFGRFVDQK